jgi:hypothetical protein
LGVVIVGEVPSTGAPLPVTDVTVAAPLTNTGTPLAEVLFTPNPPAHVPRGVVSPVIEVMLELTPAWATVPHVHTPPEYCKALAVVLHPVGTTTAVGDATPPVPFIRIVFAACAARSPTVTSPVAVKLPVTVGFANTPFVAAAAKAKAELRLCAVRI